MHNTLLEIWKEVRTNDVSFDDFVLKFENEHRYHFNRLKRYYNELLYLEGEKKNNILNAIKIEEKIIIGLFKIQIPEDKKSDLVVEDKIEHLVNEKNRIIEGLKVVEDYVSELIRKKIKYTKCLCFRIGLDNKIEVFFRTNQNEWLVIDGGKSLPCSYHMLINSKWDNALNELKYLINSPLTIERDLQKFFEVYPELLSENEFDTIIPQAVITPDFSNYHWIADFVLSPFNQFEFAKIIELKLPKVKTTKIKKPEHTSFTSQIWDSIRQVKDYAEAFDNPNIRNKFKDTYKVDIFKPDLHLIIGRSWDITQIDTIKKMKRDSQIKIETWDEVLDRLKRQFS